MARMEKMTVSKPEPSARSMAFNATTPTSAPGTEPRSIAVDSGMSTRPARYCWRPPTDLVIAA